LSATHAHLVFVMWGQEAQKKKELIDAKKHTLVCSTHPSPLAAHKGFMGSKPFSTINQALILHGQTPINW
jgi:uracil-DNA glycosylase